MIIPKWLRRPDNYDTAEDGTVLTKIGNTTGFAQTNPGSQYGVSTFNGRSGIVIPDATDYPPVLIGAEPANANIQSHVTSLHAPADAQKNSDITKAEIETKLTGVISTHSHTGGGGGLSHAQVMARIGL